jgi:glycosyltransferase involved in cell wall biosynthesis
MNNEEILISFFLPSLEGGGAEKATVRLIKGFVERGFKVDLLLSKAAGPYIKMIPEKCRIIGFNSNRVIFSLGKLINYLKVNKPFALISVLSHANVISSFAKMFYNGDTKIILTQRINLTSSKVNLKSLRSKLLPFFMFLTYWKADKIVAVSKGVAEDLEKRIHYLRNRVEYIYNPIIVPEILQQGKQVIAHSWFNNKEVPIILSAGRLTPQKDYPVLLKAFSIVRKEIECHLVILGEGEERNNLNDLAKDLEIYEDVWMPGFVDNPYKYMTKANLFVSSSKSEGFPNALIEAMACGTAVVSTDCPSGPVEILDNGKYGKLVPVGDFRGMANAIIETLKYPLGKEVLISRANQFNLDKAVSRYLEVIGIET